MSKQQLQKELLEKVKEGVKPSDLKRSNKPIQKPVKKHEQNPNKTEPKTDEGYSSDKDIPKAPPLPTEKIKDLQNQIKSLQTQLQTYKDFKEADLKIKEKLKGEIEQWKKVVEKSNTLISDKEQVISNLQTNNKVLNKTIEELKNQDKSPVKEQEPSKLFTCSQCNQEWSQEFLRLVDKKGNKTCSECLEEQLELTKQETRKEIKVEIEEKEPEPIIKPCQFCSKPYPQSELKPRHILNLPNRDPREITLICQECLIYRAKKADYYCPLTSEGKDLYESNEYDCYCPTRRNY